MPWAATSFTDCTLVPYLINKNSYVNCNDGSQKVFLQIIVVLAGLDEQVGLDVRLHLLHRSHKVIIPTIHLKINE